VITIDHDLFGMSWTNCPISRHIQSSHLEDFNHQPSQNLFTPYTTPRKRPTSNQYPSEVLQNLLPVFQTLETQNNACDAVQAISNLQRNYSFYDHLERIRDIPNDPQRLQRLGASIHEHPKEKKPSGKLEPQGPHGGPFSQFTQTRTHSAKHCSEYSG